MNEGEVLILAGPSGSGKSTISYAMNGLIPWRIKGYAAGNVKIFGKSVWDYDFIDLSKLVGLVKQNPLDQLVTFTVRDEISFGLENLKAPQYEIEDTVSEISKLMGINHLLDRNIDQLSGGQKQLTVLSSFLAMNPKILILDEPIAFLDQISESLLLSRLKKLLDSEQYNLTIVIIEHRLSRVIDIADKIVVLNEQGGIHLQGAVSEVLTEKFNLLKSSNVRVPWILDIFNKLGKNGGNSYNYRIPSDFDSGIEFLNGLEPKQLQKLRNIIIDNEIKPTSIEKLESYEEPIKFKDLYIETLKHKGTLDHELINSLPDTTIAERNILEIHNLTFEYPNSKIRAINNLSIQIKRGDFIGLVGPNGSGKTTLLYLLANLYEPTSGEILFNNQALEEIDPYEYAKNIGFIFQNPENMIFKSSIKEEILYGARNFGILDQLDEEYITKLIKLIGNETASKNPFDLSWGQKRRLNLSSIFVYNPGIILLDEPFIGQDQRTIDSLIETLFIENKRGKTIIISSHDYHLLLKYTKRIIELNKDGTLREYDISENYFNRHKNLGPIILLEEIKKKIKEISS